ncbi:MAG: 3-methyl-2-oxobutanoate hydroxymethyltransferase [Crenarchaeota archaeon 13_1_40CM_2_52_14]|nr:MAG: 3-methyl-2-oxobutanoate hydroxymethyltransferase [Crenarchaeota archaeon 13_1_40CM_3_52_17]OLD34777.1 MAG: 3-methyl-2-oxobutanoate hydroxymethyltransferase [Crenarchaeota archaeon 13_1_40CM_2_52_14]
MGRDLSENSNTEKKKVTIADFSKMKAEGRRIVMVTSYDYPTSIIADDVGVDSILVGDSYGMVVLGYDTTIPVTVEELLPVCQAVKRGASHSLLIGDMPFLSFQISEEDAIGNAGRFIKEGRMEAVKIEGGKDMAHIAKAVANTGIPVLGHIGLTPQTATLHGGYRIQGKNAHSGKELIEDAKSLEAAGVFGIVLEMITEEVARVITQTVSVPTIGIGSGRYCDGQILVLHDILGLYPRFVPKFAKRYTDLASTIKGAIGEYTSEVRHGTFPEEKHVFKMDDAERSKLDLRQKS